MQEPKRNNNAIFVTMQDAMAEMNMCRKSVDKLSREAGALVKYGRVVRVNMPKLIEYVTDVYSA